VELRVNLFHQKAKRFLDDCLANHTIGTEFYIEVIQSGYHPFTDMEMEDQVRACYGRRNREIHFTTLDKPNESFRCASTAELRKQSEELVQRFFIDGDDLANGEVPPEVYHFLQAYKERSKQLSNYLIKGVKHT